MIGMIGKITIRTTQKRRDAVGESIGPRPIGENNEKITPRYKLINGAGVNLEIIRAIVTLAP
jgi:hypothetical protein